MNAAVELHDSRIASAERVGPNLVVTLDPAIVHRSELRPGWDSGTGWHQRVELVFAEGMVHGGPEQWPLDLDDGAFPEGGAWYDGMLPLPFSVAGPIRFEAFGLEGEVFAVTGSGLTVRAAGKAEYREEFPGA